MSTQRTNSAEPRDSSDSMIIALVTLKQGRTGFYWVVARCPICGKKHLHGAGSLDGDPRQWLGHRCADCGAAGVGYTLVEKAGAR